MLGVRELDQSKINGESQNWLNLHTVYTHGNDMIAAFANQRTAANGEQELGDTDKTQWAEGNQPGQDALAQATGGLRDPGLLRREQPGLLRGRQGEPPTAPSVELN